MIKIITKPIITEGGFNNNFIKCESQGDRYRDLSVEGYLKKIRLNKKNIINNLKETADTRKIKLAVKIMLKSLKDDREEKICNYGTTLLTEDIINVIFYVLLMQYQEEMVVNMRGSEFIYDYVDKLCYGCHKIPLDKKGTCV